MVFNPGQLVIKLLTIPMRLCRDVVSPKVVES
jgi:hypothetical protein